MQRKFNYWRFAVLVLTVLLCGRDAIAQPGFDMLEFEKSVVRILTTPKGTGTGFVINDRGYIATNAHVIAGKQQVYARPTNSSDPYKVQVIHTSSELDLAIVRAEGLNLPPITFSLAESKKGQKVWVIGYPGDADWEGHADDPTVDHGVIGRFLYGTWKRQSVWKRLWKSQTLRIIQHGAPLNPGNSGGPLVDDCGRVIGVNTKASLIHVRDSSGNETLVRKAAGLNWSSDIKELARLLQDNNIAFRSETQACVPADGPGSAEATKEALERADQAEQKADRALIQQNQFLKWGGGILGFLILIALAAFVVKKRRQQSVPVAEGVDQIGEDQKEPQVTQKKYSIPPIEEPQPQRNLVLSGFDGTHVRIALSPEKFSGQRLGLSLGRHPGLVDEVVDNETVSRRHVRIAARDDGFYIEDLNSRYGTFLNDQRLKPFNPVQLDYGAKVKLGSLELAVSEF